MAGLVVQFGDMAAPVRRHRRHFRPGPGRLSPILPAAEENPAAAPLRADGWRAVRQKRPADRPRPTLETNVGLGGANATDNVAAIVFDLAEVGPAWLAGWAGSDPPEPPCREPRADVQHYKRAARRRTRAAPRPSRETTASTALPCSACDGIVRSCPGFGDDTAGVYTLDAELQQPDAKAGPAPRESPHGEPLSTNNASGRP